MSVPVAAENLIKLRPVVASDEAFLARLYATTRDDINGMDWPESRKEELCHSQFRAQHEHYQRYFPEAAFDLILIGDKAVGRVYVNCTDEEIRVIDISLLPEFRQRGIGTQIMNQIIDEAGQEGKTVRLRVQPGSVARRWYESMGFSLLEDEQINWHMERRDNHER